MHWLKLVVAGLLGAGGAFVAAAPVDVNQLSKFLDPKQLKEFTDLLNVKHAKDMDMSKFVEALGLDKVFNADQLKNLDVNQIADYLGVDNFKNLLTTKLRDLQPCVKGPDYICATRENAKRCMTSVSVCQTACKYAGFMFPKMKRGEICNPKKGGASKGPPEETATAPEKTTAGSEETTTTSEETTTTSEETETARPPMGSNPCTWGPSYWCASFENAKRCDFEPTECQKYCDTPDEYATIKDGEICNPGADAHTASEETTTASEETTTASA